VPLTYGQFVGTGPTIVEDGVDELVGFSSVVLNTELVENGIGDEVDDKELDCQLKDIDDREPIGESVGE
jgi:hypothetical protein